MIKNFLNHQPKIHPSVWIADNAVVIGRCELGAQSSVWFGAVIRGDVNFIRIGERSNIQDNSVLHVTGPSAELSEGFPLIIGNDVTVGHQAVLHACTIGNACLVGMNSTVLDGAVIGDESLVAAGALVTPNKIFSPRSLIMGTPARFVRELTDKEVADLYKSAIQYAEYMEKYLRSGK